MVRTKISILATLAVLLLRTVSGTPLDRPSTIDADNSAVATELPQLEVRANEPELFNFTGGLNNSFIIDLPITPRSVSFPYEKNGDTLESKVANQISQGYRIISISAFGDTNPRYTAVLWKETGPKQVFRFGMRESELDTFVADNKRAGFTPVLIGATGTDPNDRYSIVMEDKKPATSQFRCQLSAVGFDNLYLYWKSRSTPLVDVAAYGPPGAKKFCGIWSSLPSSSTIYAGADAPQTIVDYTNSFDFWRRHSPALHPARVTITQDFRFKGLFTNTNIGAWSHYYPLTAATLQDILQVEKRAGRELIMLDGYSAGIHQTSASYVATFAQRPNPQ